MDIEELGEFNLLKEYVKEVGLQRQSLDSEQRRLVYLIEFLKDPYDIVEFIFKCFIILKCVYRRYVSNYLWLIILSKVRNWKFTIKLNQS